MGTFAAFLALQLASTPAAPSLAQRVPDPYVYPEPAWSPYIVGALLGVLVLLTLSLAGKKVGASSAYADAAGMLGRKVAPKHIASLPYYQQSTPNVGWTFLFVIGAVAGALLGALTGNEWNGAFLQPLWIARFGTDSAVLRIAIAFAGGVLMAYGARMAGGCTSGHGISGTLQLSVSSWVAVLCFFAGGVIAAVLVYRS